jgi:type VI secretion system protein ImpH
MAGKKRFTDADLIAWLADDGKHFGFFQAVDVIERIARSTAPVGFTGPAAEEAIRFEHDPDLIFHASDIKWIAPRDERAGRPHTIIRTTFLGLFGSVSPLPVNMAEDVLAADAAEQPSLRAFYDLFHHRLISLFFRTWQKNRLPSGHRADMGDAFTRRVLSFVGVDVAGALPSRSPAPLDLLGLAPLLGRRLRTPHAFKVLGARLLEGIDVRVESFVLRRTALSPEQRVTLGVRNTRLGVDTAIGSSVADRAGRFRVLMGPLSEEHFAAVSPGGRLHGALSALCDHFSDGVLEAEVDIEMSAEQVPRFRLGAGTRLGRTTRLGGKSVQPLRSTFVVGSGAPKRAPRVTAEARSRFPRPPPR